MPKDDYGNQGSPYSGAGSTLTTLGQILGGGGILGRGLTLAGMSQHQQAYEQFEKANRPKQLDLFERHGLISKEDRPYYEQLPTASWEAIGPNFQKELTDKQKATAPTPFYNQQTGQIEYVTPQSGMTLPKGLLPPTMYNAMQGQQEREKAQQEHEREFGINKTLQEQNFGATMGLRREGIESNNAMRAATLANTQAQQATTNELARGRMEAARQQQLATQEAGLQKRQQDIAALQAAGKASPTTLKALQGKWNADAAQFKKRADAVGYPTSGALDPLAVKDEPGLLKRAFGYGPSSSSLVPAPIAPIPAIPPGLSAPPATMGRASISGPGGVTHRSKSGRPMKPDPSSPTGYSYAD